jgi:hypothetical protein
MESEEEQAAVNLSGSPTADWVFLRKNSHELGKRAYELFP